MKIVTYEVENKTKLGIFSADGQWVYPLECFGIEYQEMQEAIAEMSDSEIQLLNHMSKKDPYETPGAARIEEVKILAPILRPKQDVICLGMNYQKHKTEAERFDAAAFTREKAQAVYFSKRATHCPGPGAPIPGHFDLVDSLDYETELAVILGRDAKNVTEAEAFDYVFGYTIVNDVSARNLQTGHKQWYFGKGLDGFTPMGPCIVTKEAFPQPPAQAIRTWVNGQLRQEAVTDQLIFSIPHILRELSQGMTLQAGTIIATGTPAGVGMGFDPPRFLRAGDVVRCEIEGIGVLENTVEG